ncbi:MAG: hypothetical protein Q8N17_19485, partial [Burkholderiaceae bacterium]|nr:hypothetical protein [Burkholderiaceae bacterium]
KVRLNGRFDRLGVKHATDSIAVARSQLALQYPETDKALSYTTRILEATVAQLNRNYGNTGYAKAVQALMVMAATVAGAFLTGGPGALLVPGIVSALSSALGTRSVKEGQDEAILKQQDTQLNKITQEFGSMVAGFESGPVLSHATSTSPVQMEALSNCVDDYIRAAHATVPPVGKEEGYSRSPQSQKAWHYIENMHSAFKNLGATSELRDNFYQSALQCKPSSAADKSQSKDPLKETMIQTLRLLLLETTAFSAAKSREIAADLGYAHTRYRDRDLLLFNRQFTEMNKGPKYA